MAEQAFTTRDVERILKALFPDVRENPLGEIRSQLIEVREELLAFEQQTDATNEELFEELDKIQARTFGILILQIIKTIKTLMGLLPAGRVILLAIAAIGLITTLLENGEVTGSDIKNAVEQSGFGAFIREQLRRIQDIASAQAQRIEDVIDLGSDVVQAGARKAEVVLGDLEFTLNQLETETFENAEQVVDAIRPILIETADQALQLLNLTSNSDSLIFGALRAVPERIRRIPQEAASLVE